MIEEDESSAESPKHNNQSEDSSDFSLKFGKTLPDTLNVKVRRGEKAETDGVLSNQDPDSVRKIGIKARNLTQISTQMPPIKSPVNSGNSEAEKNDLEETKSRKMLVKPPLNAYQVP